MRDKNQIFYLANLSLLIISSFFLIFPTPELSPVLLVIPFLWVLSWVVTGKVLPVTPLNPPILMLMGMVLVSLYATYDIAVSLPKISGMVLGVGMFFALVSAAQSGKSVRIPLAITLLSGLGMALVGLLGLRQFQKFSLVQPLVARLPVALTSLPGAEGGFHPNEVAGALLWLLPMLAALLGLVVIKINSWRKQIGWWKPVLAGVLLMAAFLFVAGELLLTQSRSALLGLVLSPVLLLPLLFKKKLRWAAYAILVLAGSFGGWLAWTQGWLQKIYEVTTLGGTSASVTTLNGRVEIWSRAIYGIQDFAFTGMGMNTFRKVMPILYPLITISPEIDIGHAHNELLQAALDLGMPGMIAFLALYIVAFSMLGAIWQRAGSRRIGRGAGGVDGLLLTPAGMKALVLGIGASLLAHALYGLTDAVALGAKPGILLWMLLGLTAGLHSLVRGISRSHRIPVGPAVSGLESSEVEGA